MNFFEGELSGTQFRTKDGAVFDMTGYAFDKEGAQGSAWLGIRPEHLMTGAAAEAAPISVDAEIEFIEPLGSDTLVRVSALGRHLWVREDGQADVKPRQALRIGFDASLAHLFHADSETRL
jgi:multiple sugar transport system ATP-binding protein